MANTEKNNGVLVYHPSPEPLLARPPFLARHPWVGFLIFIVGTLGFLFVTQQVITKGPLTGSDAAWIQAIHNWAKQQSQPLVLFMRFWSSYGRDGVTLITLILAVGWIRRKARRELWMLFFGVLGGELWFQALSNIIKRTRPPIKDPFETLIGPGFPSGHAVTNVLLGWMIMYLLWPHIRTGWKRALLVIVVVLAVVLVLVSRLFLGLHYPTDILGGVLLGLAWGGFVYTITDLHFFRRRVRTERQGFNPVVMPVTGEIRHTRVEDKERS